MKKTQRTFIPGSKWLYLKLYSGSKTADKILINNISAIVKGAYKKQLIEKWFFIRYSDPDPHLRIRFLLKDESHIGSIVESIYNGLKNVIKDKLVSKVQFDTYNRELERYGDFLIEYAESIFHFDSECTLSILKRLDKQQNEDYRWMVSIRMIETFLSDFNLGIQSKQRIMNELNNSFKREFGFNQHNAKQFNTKYREKKLMIEDILNNSYSDSEFLRLILPIQKRSRKIKDITDDIESKVKNKNLNVTLDSLLKSYIHMMINRLFTSKNRAHELVLYDFMDRYYTSKIARQKYITKK